MPRRIETAPLRIVEIPEGNIEDYIIRDAGVGVDFRPQSQIGGNFDNIPQPTEEEINKMRGRIREYHENVSGLINYDLISRGGLAFLIDPSTAEKPERKKEITQMIGLAARTLPEPNQQSFIPKKALIIMRRVETMLAEEAQQPQGENNRSQRDGQPSAHSLNIAELASLLRTDQIELRKFLKELGITPNIEKGRIGGKRFSSDQVEQITAAVQKAGHLRNISKQDVEARLGIGRKTANFLYPRAGLKLKTLRINKEGLERLREAFAQYLKEMEERIENAAKARTLGEQLKILGIGVTYEKYGDVLDLPPQGPLTKEQLERLVNSKIQR